MPTDAGRFDPTKGTWSVSASRPPTTDAVPLGLQQSFFDSLKLRFQAAADPVSPSKAWLVHVHTKGDTKAAIYDLIDGYNSPSVESKPSTWSFDGMAAIGRRVPPFQRKFRLKGYQRLMPIGDDAARLIVGLPAVIQARLWRWLPVGTQLGTGISLWALAVFELANANYPLRAARTISFGEKPVSFKPPSDADWSAMLPDFAAASVQAIDVLMSWLDDVPKREAEVNSKLPKMGERHGETLARAEANGKPTKGKKAGHRRTSEELFKAALRNHHKYETDGSVLNVEPVSTRQIETLTERGVSDSTAGRLLAKHFGSVEKYRGACFSGAIGRKLVVLLGDGLHAFGSFDATERDVEDQNDNDSDE